MYTADLLTACMVECLTGGDRILDLQIGMNNFIELLEYNIWANRRILSQVKYIVLEETLRDTCDCRVSMQHALLHLLKADWIWFDLWKGQAIREYPKQWDGFTVMDIERVWPAMQDSLLEELRSVFPPRIDDEVVFSNGDEVVHLVKFYESINLVIVHGSYYRGQIGKMIDIIGLEPVKTQLFDYYARRIHS